MEKYEIITRIGNGACGAVYLVTSKINGRQLALKKVQLDDKKKTRTREALLREAKILAKLKHPHIVAYHDSFFASDAENSYMHIVQDYCDGGTLDERIAKQRKSKELFEEKIIMEWFIQIAMAVQYIHSHRILHRDLKAQNVFMTKSDGVKLGDFGIAKALDNTLDAAVTCVGTPCYLSPELCQDIPYSSKADIWALGCLLYEMCALQPAFDANNLISLFYKIMKVEHAVIPEQYSHDLKSIISSLLAKSPDERPSAGAILNLPVVRTYLEVFISDREYLLKQRIISIKVKSGKIDGSLSPTAIHQQTNSLQKSQPNMNITKKSPSPVACRRSLDDLDRYLKNETALPQQSLDHKIVTRKSGDSSSSEQLRDSDDLNYSDDFDNSDSCDDEIPEELENVEETICNSLNNEQAEAGQFNNSGTQQRDFADFEEYADDFEDDSEAEELDLIVNHAKEVHTANQAEDEFFIDTEHNPSTKTALRKHCLGILNHRSQAVKNLSSTDYRLLMEHKIENDHMETCYLLEELGEF